MISDHIKFEVGKMAVDVNWSKKVTPCKKIRFKFDGVVEVIDRDELFSLLMLFGDDRQQEDLIPVTKTEMRVIERLLHVRVKRDMKEGEVINFPYKYALPVDIYERLLRENPKDYRAPAEPIKPPPSPELSTGDKTKGDS